MRFLVDASSDARIVAHLRTAGHDVTRIGTDYPGTLEDSDVLAIAQREQRILITDDRDFGELVFRLNQPQAGVIYLRFNTTRIAIRLARRDHVLTHYAPHLDQFVVVTPDEVWIRSAQMPKPYPRACRASTPSLRLVSYFPLKSELVPGRGLSVVQRSDR